MELTWKEALILVAAIAFILSIVFSVLKHSIRMAIAICVAILLFSGFTWLPEKIKEWTSADKPAPDVNEVVDTVKDGWNDYIDAEGESWIDAANSLWQKITGKAQEQEGN